MKIYHQFDILGGAVSLVLHGKRSGDWRGLYGGLPARDITRRKLASRIDAYGLTAAHIPNVAPANSLVVSSRSDWFKPVAFGDVVLFDSVEADGVILERGDSFALATGDCPTIVAYAEKAGFAVAAHAGRQSLLGSFVDRPGQAPLSGKFLKDSLVAGIVQCFVDRRVSCDPREIDVFVTLGIGAAAFDHLLDHPVYGAANERMLRFVRREYGKRCIKDDARGTLSLRDVIEVQFHQCGVPPKNLVFDGFDTAMDREADGSFRWWSNRRGETGRNLVFVHAN
jgi:copper oxidase (laccase) domain-containing protein